MSNGSSRSGGTNRTTPSAHSQKISSQNSHLMSKIDSKALVNDQLPILPIAGPPVVTRHLAEYRRNDLGRCLAAGYKYFQLLFRRTAKEDPEAEARKRDRLEKREREQELRRLQTMERCTWHHDGQAGFRIQRVPVVPRPVCVGPIGTVPTQPTPKQYPLLNPTRPGSRSSAGAQTLVDV